MSLLVIKREELRPVFEALEDVFHRCGIDYYLIGALARDIWYAKAKKRFRTTNDIDFAVLIGSNEQYEQVRDLLLREKGYTASATSAFVLFAPNRAAVDLLPFGSVEMDSGVELTGKGLNRIRVDGFKEVHQSGTEEIEVLDGFRFEVATLPSIILLKLIAYDDRPEERSKDARDIANILIHYFELQADLIYDKHHNLFADGQPERELEEISAVVIGRQLWNIVEQNDPLYRRMISILKTHVDKGENGEFVRNMMQETDRSLQEVISWLTHLLFGLEERK